MSIDLKDIEVLEPKKLAPIKNRKQRRFEAKNAKKTQKETRSFADTIKNTVNQMQQSTRVQEVVVSGKLDKYLAK